MQFHRCGIKLSCLLVGILLLPAMGACAATAPPNIVLIFAEDLGVELACYGHPAVRTPNLDTLAAGGVRYANAFTTAPSCTPSRNAIMTGVYQTRTDTQDQRRPGVTLPPGVGCITEALQAAGYYTALGCGYSNKTDFNFVGKTHFAGADWKRRRPGQPFFAQITLYGTHRNPELGWDPVRKASASPVDPAKVVMPPYIPDDDRCRLDWAMYLDAIEAMDHQVGKILSRLEQEGIADETVVIFIGDNGRDHMRGKCWLYEGGIHVPLIVRGLPGKKVGSVEDRLISAIDVSATILELAGAEPPAVFDGKPFGGSKATARQEIFAARDVIDEVWDVIRCVRTERYKYIRNLRPEIGYQEGKYSQHVRQMFPVMQELAREGRLTPIQRLSILERKPAEELYDLQNDPHELVNLAAEPEYANTLSDLSQRLDGWIADTHDRGISRFKQAHP